MSATFPTNPAAYPGTSEEPTLFSREELQQFAADDAAAGARIGKILGALFIYTLVVMSVAIWWTYRIVGF
jgi:hypothetical protein